jgi:hypothetical protein
MLWMLFSIYTYVLTVVSDKNAESKLTVLNILYKEILEKLIYEM